MSLIEVNNAEVYYGPIRAVKGVSFRVERGEIVALIGANGAGKTTVLHAMSGLLPVRGGEIFYNGHNLLKMPAHKIVRLGLTQVPEGRRVFAELSVKDNLLLGAYTRKNKKEIKETLEDGISINNGWGPKEILKDEKGNVKAVVFKKCLSVIDPKTNRFNPQYDENDTITVEAQHVIFAIGQSVVWNDLLKGTKVEFHHGNYPVADSLTYQTAEPDIFVGGDVYSGPKFAIDAIEAGKNAAVSLHRFVQPGTSMTIGRNRRQFVELDKDNIVIDSYDTAGRQEAKELDGDKHSFRDLHGTLTEEQVRIEASRCLGCGASIVDENKCIGCGICTTKCEFDAIHLHREHPECSKMSRSEDKFKEILPYAIKRGMKIAFGKKTPEEKASQKRHKAAKKAAKQAKKDK